jgi:hydroxyacylglutathione hydrolase
MELIALAALSDNYIWMLHDGARAIVVDPGDARPVLEALRSRSLDLVGILVTHHHADHTAGLEALSACLAPGDAHRVYGPAVGHIEQVRTRVRGGDVFELLGVRWEVLDLPGHTLDHIGFFTADAGQGLGPVVFCGDTLFSAGCGRLFEGTPAQLHASLQRLASLPSITKVCCTHEYTLSNLKFAMAIDPENPALSDHLQRCRLWRQQGLPTLPSSIGLERAINPFLRCEAPAIVASAAAHDPGVRADDPVSVLAALRAWKNSFQ